MDETSYNFISLVGGQIFGTLNPLLVCLKNYHIKKVFLVPTETTIKHANKIRTYLGEKRPDVEVKITKISRKLVEVGGNPAPQEVISSKAKEGPFIFNVDGGLKFQMIASVVELAKDANIFEQGIFLYAESQAGKARAYQFKDGLAEDPTIKIFSVRDILQPQEVLDLQGIKFHQTEDEEDASVVRMFGNYDIRAGQAVLKQVTIFNESDSLRFDRVINLGNKLVFVSYITTEQLGEQLGAAEADEKRREKYWQTQARRICEKASGREFFKDLYDREIVILTNHVAFTGHINPDGAGKVKAVFYQDKDSLAAELIKIYGIKVAAEEVKPEPRLERHPQEARGADGSVCFMPLAKDVLTTLIAYRSHMPGMVCFTYTPTVGEVVGYKDKIVDNLNLFSSSQVYFYQTSVSGEEILSLPLEKVISAGQRFDVNVTPGTKGQSFFLMILALKNGGNVYSIDTDTQQLGVLHRSTNTAEPKLKSLQGPTIKMLLKTKGIPIEYWGRGPNKIESARILQFVRRMLEASENRINQFPHVDNIELSQDCKYQRDGKVGILTLPGENEERFNIRKGKWFEDLVGYCAQQLGADVRIGLKIQWAEEIEERLRELRERRDEQDDGNTKVQKEIDVIVQWKNRYYVISCKTDDPENLDSDEVLAYEVRAAKNIFGRFTVPLIASYKFAEEPDEIKGGENVRIFGYKTLIAENGLRDLLEQPFSK